mgnify:CR=1 FL=1
MADILKKNKIFPDLILSSDAVRAAEFAKIIADVLPYKKKNIQFTNDLYLANENEMLKIVREIDDEIETAFLVSHNPGITYFANLLCNHNTDNIPTSGIFGINFDVKSWKEIKFGIGKFLLFEYPKKYYP